MTSQLELDLDRRIRDRLSQWARDSISLFEMAGFSEAEAATAMVSAVFSLSAFAACCTGETPEEMGQQFADAIRFHRKRMKTEG